MKILMVSSFLPYPLINGGNVRLYNLLKNLSKNFEVTLICEKREFQTNKDVDEVKKFCKKIITVDRKKQWAISNILKAAFSLESFLIVGHTIPEMERKIKEELNSDSYDLIHVETFYVMQNLPKTLAPIILVEHNIEYMVYKRYVDHSPFFIKPFLNWDVWKMKNKEQTFWKNAKILVAVSQKEKKIMNADEVVPNGVDTEKFKFQNSSLKFKGERHVLFIGDFKWIENRDTAKWIIEKIWPEIKLKVNSGIKLWIVGKKIPNSIKKLSKDSNIIFDEDAPDDTYLIYKRAHLLLSPIRIGGGTSFKILEAMASGVPVVTTKLGAEGITRRNELISADNVAQISESTVKLLNNKDYYERIAKNARKLVEEKYNWRYIANKLENVYMSARKGIL